MGNASRCLRKPGKSSPQRSPTGQTLPSTGQSQQQLPSSQQPLPSLPSSSQQPLPSSSQQQTRRSLEEEIIANLTKIKNPAQLDLLICTIKNILQHKFRHNNIENTASSHMQDKDLWISSVTNGDALLNFVNVHTGNEEYIFSDSRESTRVVTDILQRIGQAHWVVGVLCIGAYLVQNFEKVSENQRECFQLLNRIVGFASIVKTLNDVIPEEENKLKDAVALIVEGSILCISQMNSHKFFRFLKTSVNSEKLNNLSTKIGQEHDSLILIITSRTKKDQSITLPVEKPLYPKHAVGIKVPEEEVIQLLKFTHQHESPLAVVIYGVGGIGKTTLASAVLARADLSDYLYARVYFDDRDKNNIKEMQQHILKDAFPNYQSSKIDFRDWAEGQERLQKAFECPENKPIILFIDNASRSNLKKLLPDSLQCLPKGSRMLLTTRRLDVADILSDGGLEWVPYLLKTLPAEQAMEILCKDTGKLGHINCDWERILQICGGIPLLLKVVGANLEKSEYNVEECQILDALKNGTYIKLDNLSKRLLGFVYNEFESNTKDAFLDICCFFNRCYRRRIEYIFGKQQVKSLEQAGLLASVVVGNEKGVNDGEQEIAVSDIVRVNGRRLSQSTRIMDIVSWNEAAQYKSRLKRIKGVGLEDDSSEFALEERHLRSVANSLRILALGDRMRTSAQSQMKFRQLRYLRVGSGIPQLPMQFHALPELRGYEGPVFIEGVSLYKLPRKLLTIQARPDGTNFVIPEEPNPEQAIPNTVLKELHLLEFKHVGELQGGLPKFSALKILILDWWEVELPEEVCRLSSLEKFRLRGFGILKRLPKSFGCLNSLTHLDLSFCKALEDLPSSFGQLRKLKHLDLRGCRMLKELHVEQLIALEYLDVSACINLRLDVSNLPLKNLKVKSGEIECNTLV